MYRRKTPIKFPAKSDAAKRRWATTDQKVKKAINDKRLATLGEGRRKEIAKKGWLERDEAYKKKRLRVKV